jgi:hypothetical protein
MNVASTEPRTWNYKLVISALLLGVWLQWHFLVLYSGHAIDVFWHTLVFQAALLFDGLVAVRIAVAALRRERNRAWVIYSLLCLTSFLWIAVMAAIIGMILGF